MWRLHAAELDFFGGGPATRPRLEAVGDGEALDGSMAGDEGFDPLGFTTTITELGGDLKYVCSNQCLPVS